MGFSSAFKGLKYCVKSKSYGFATRVFFANAIFFKTEDGALLMVNKQTNKYFCYK